MSVLLGLALGGSACTKMNGAGGSASRGSAAMDPKAPVAKVGGQVITAGELAEVTKARLAKLEADHAEKVYQLKSEALDELVEKRLIEAKAKREGLTSEKLVERDVKPKDPTDAEIQQVYDRAKASGRQVPPFEQVKGEIAKMLKDRSSGEGRRVFVDKLKAEAKVEVLLPPLLMPKVEVALEGQSKGPSNAPINIVEFSDYQCPYCIRFFRDTMPLIEQEYINTGKVKYVFRNLPLESIHPFAVKAAEAADCAGEQGKFWQMHRRLFSNQEALGPADLQLHAQSIGLDLTRFNQCLSGGSHAPAIRKGAEEAFSAGIQGTPAFVIGVRNEKDPSDPNIKVVSIISGAQPYSVFQAAINNLLGVQNQ